MSVLYLDCAMGAAGDMLTAALLELFENREAVLQELNAMQIPGVRFVAESSVKCGITGTHIRVMVGSHEEDEHVHHHGHHHHDHHHSDMAEIAHILSHMTASQRVKENVLAVYDLIAQAESLAHGVPVEQIHFHEVGQMDAIADISAVCYLMEKLQPERVCASAVHVGSGQVQCAHGILPVPAPATAHILKGVPIYGGQIKGELCTPTGAALLKHFVTEFGNMPVMNVTAIGYGMGKKDFPAANCVRAMLGKTDGNTDEVLELSCNLDDMTPEEVGFACQQLRETGALEVFTTAVTMKKDRPGILLTVLCRPEDRELMVSAMFRYTTTLGIRQAQSQRYTLSRRMETVETPWGPVRKKVSSGYGVERSKYEYEDLAQIARQTGKNLRQIVKE